MIGRAGAGGLAYFAAVFTLGAALGTVRTLHLEPQLGEMPATLAELPLMLGASWLICSWVVRSIEVPAETRSRLLMGATAFVLLMAAEAALTVFGEAGTLARHFQAYREPARQLGLAGQFLFAAFPIILMREPVSRRAV